MELIDLSKHARDPKYYNRDRDIETALAWNAVKKTLIEVGREDLFAYIKSVKVTEKSITISTGKPIVNSELQNYKKTLILSINDQRGGIGKAKHQKILRLS